MSPEENDNNVLKYVESCSPGGASEKQVMFLNSLLDQGDLFESDFEEYEYCDTSTLTNIRVNELIQLGLARQSQARAKRNEILKSKCNKIMEATIQEGNKMRNETTLDRAIAAEMQTCAGTLVDLTTLKAIEIAALMKIYDLCGFFRKYTARIIEKQMGVLIAEIVLSILNLRKCRAEYIERIGKSANDNPKLTEALKHWIMNDVPKTMDNGNHRPAYTRPETPEGIEQEQEDEQEDEGLVDMEEEND